MASCYIMDTSYWYCVPYTISYWYSDPYIIYYIKVAMHLQVNTVACNMLHCHNVDLWMLQVTCCMQLKIVLKESWPMFKFRLTTNFEYSLQLYCPWMATYLYTIYYISYWYSATYTIYSYWYSVLYSGAWVGPLNNDLHGSILLNRIILAVFLMHKHRDGKESGALLKKESGIDWHCWK